MRQTFTIVILSGCIMLPLCSTATAQFWPGYGYGGYGDNAGVWGAYTSAMESNATRYIAEANRMQGQRAAMQQQAALQSNIRNTLSSQAQARTQSDLARRQSAGDWWFQVQQQQLAQSRPASGGASRSRIPASGFESMPAPAAPAATDIIRWPPLLCEPIFADQRATVEAPYRRTPKTDPTAEDYRDMLDAVKEMTSTLSQVTAEISAQEYLYAEKFLDQLAGEVNERLKQDQPVK